VYFLPLDRRLPWQTGAVTAAKRVIYEGFRQAVIGEVLPRCAGIIADELTAGGVLRDAAARGFATMCSRGPLDGPAANVDDAVMAHAAECTADSWRVNVRYNPGGNHAHNTTQADRARVLIRTLAGAAHARVACDLVVSPTAAQIARGIRAFDRDLRGELTACAITELAEQGVEPDIWIVEGFESQEDYARVVAAAHRSGRHAGCLVRAAGYGDETTCRLMAAGLSVAGIVGVVLAPAAFWEPATAWMKGETTRAAAVAAVARRLRSWMSALQAGDAGEVRFAPSRREGAAAWPQWS
jgi:hypothetical protein